MEGFDKTKTDLQHLGLSILEVEIYLHILAKGKKSISELRKDLSSSRGRIERSVNRLQDLELVSVFEDEKGKFIQSTEVSRIYNLLELKKKHFEERRLLWPQLMESLDELNNTHKKNVEAKVKHYSGTEGLKQVMWNSVNAEGIVRLFEVSEMSEFLDYGFYEKVRKEYVERGISSHELTNNKVMPGWTDVNEYVKNFWEARYIDPTKLKMKFEMLLYNNVVVLYHSSNYEVFCVEVYNDELARMQKQTFDFMWNRGAKMNVLDEHGKAIVSKHGPVS